MSNSTHTTVRTGVIASLSATLLTLGACGQQRTNDLTQSESDLILEEIGIADTLNGYPQNTLNNTQNRPSLVAGDWIAFQFAHADTLSDPNWFNQSNQPAYANIVTSDFE